MATERFVDTNLLLRHIADDHPTHSPAATALFRRIDSGEERAWTTLMAIAETVWVLTGRSYGLPPAEVRDVLSDLLQIKNLRIEGRAVLMEGLNIFAESNVSFIDAYHAALLRQLGRPEFYSFDKGLDRIPGITRIEP